MHADASPQNDGPERGIAAELVAFAAMCRQARAYGRFTRPGRRQAAAERAGRRQQLSALAAQVNERLSFRQELTPVAKLQGA